MPVMSKAAGKQTVDKGYADTAASSSDVRGGVPGVDYL
jgi:hypothetical protein